MNALQAIADTVAVDTSAPSWPAIGSMVLTLLVFPFLSHFFRKNEKQHEETRAKIGTHSETLVLHEYRIFRLEQPGAIPPNAVPHSTRVGD